MNFGLALTSTHEMDKSDIIIDLSEDMTFFFQERNYGLGIKSYVIGIYCRNIPPGFEKFSVLPKPVYIKGKKIINPDGIPFTLEDSFEYSINLDFQTFQHATKVEAEKILADEILKSLKVLDEMKSKIKDFDAVQFKSDLETYFKGKGLI